MSKKNSHQRNPRQSVSVIQHKLLLASASDSQLDRMTRCLRLYKLLSRVHGGVTMQEVAHKLEVGLRTAYRDVECLQTLNVGLKNLGNVYYVE